MRDSILSGRSTIVARRDHVSCNLASEAVILDVNAGVYYGLNTLGARIWDLIQQPRTLHEVRETILQEFDVDPERCQRDLVVLLSDLASRKLIEIGNETAA